MEGGFANERFWPSTGEFKLGLSDVWLARGVAGGERVNEVPIGISSLKPLFDVEEIGRLTWKYVRSLKMNSLLDNGDTIDG